MLKIKSLNIFFKNKKKFSNFHNSNRLNMLNKIYPKKNFLNDIQEIIK